ncbi:MAG TPA: hypothetical protein VII12_00515 [Thermoanaerobaculia bacterium]|jgi:hypothetical protein
MSLRVWQFINIFLSALVAGVFWGPWLGLSRSIASFTPETFLAIGQRMIGNLAPVMPILMPAAILSTIPVLSNARRIRALCRRADHHAGRRGPYRSSDQAVDGEFAPR